MSLPKPVGLTIACAFLAAVFATGQFSQAQTAPPLQKIEETKKSIRETLAQRLGLSSEELRPELDLVADLGLDRGIVSDELQRLYDELGVARPLEELRHIEQIAGYLAIAKKEGFDKTRGESRGYLVQEVYFATTRKRTGNQLPERFFGSERSPGGAISYGIAEVNIPESHKRGMLETPFLQIRTLLDRGNHIYVVKLDTQLTSDVFFEDIGIKAQARQKEVLIYVHGFNVSFDDAIRRAAQMSIDLGFQGPPIVFSWPSHQSVAKYNGDWAEVLWSVRHLEQFFRDVHEKLPGFKIHLIAHSMGSMASLHAMRLLAARGAGSLRFASVILCAPDFDRGLFAEQVATEVKSLSARWAVYQSRRDFALMISERVNAAPRLGRPVAYAEGYDVIDASDIEVTPWNVSETHSYYGTKVEVIKDIVGVIAGVAPSNRGLRSMRVDGGTVWSMR